MKQVIVFWNWLGTRRTYTARAGRTAVYAILCFLAFESITARFEWPEQLVLGLLTIAVAIAIHRSSKSELVTLALMFASISATLRYGYWRCSTVFGVITDPAHRPDLINLGFMMLLLSAEIYAFVILVLGFVQTARPLQRRPAAMPADVGAWPDIDILIPTYNEPLSIVRSTTFAAVNIDYPPEKLHVYICDDGRRPEFRQFCEEFGVGYIIRGDNKHAKAGNINHALKQMHSPYVAIFDCDHIPTRSFLQMTVGWFFRDYKLGLVQTPHFFYSPDPFERNLSQFKVIPNEGELFYGVLQDGNDLWNATFFCGSCAVLRREALDQVGGIAVETVTEDAHTSLRMQMRGWNTAYINLPQAAGLATESLSSHVGQRIRWARGMVQVLRTDNPLTAKGLTWPQRLCYLNAMLHFLYAVPRLVFLTAPLVYMLLGRINIPGHWIAILAYSFPHLFMANVVNFRVQGKHRYSFWNEVYEAVLAPYILMPTLLALINPKLGKFNVTAKGGIVEKSYFDRRIARPYVLLIMLNFSGLLVAPVRYFYWDANHHGTVIMNVVWILFNLVIIGTANAVAIESRQLRNDVRVDLKMPVEIRLADGRSIFGETVDMSVSGSQILLEEPLQLTHGSTGHVFYPLRKGQLELPLLVVQSQGSVLRFRYDKLDLKQEEDLTQILYSRADMWISRSEKRIPDRPLHSFLRLVSLSFRGIGIAFSMLRPQRKSAVSSMTGAGATAAMLALACLLAAPRAHALQDATGNAEPAGGQFHSTISFKNFGYPDAIQFRGVEATQSIPFSLSHTQIVNDAQLNLHYTFSPGLLPQLSHLNVLLNGVAVATLPVMANSGQVATALTATVKLPAELLARTNQLGFQFIGHYTQSCEDPANTTLWARIDPNTSLELSGSSLELSNDLKQLPLPFFDGEVDTLSASIPFDFATTPSHEGTAAAGVLASWFGVQAKARALSFPVTIATTMPHGNVVLLVEGSNQQSLPAELQLPGGGPRVGVRSNPSDRFGKVLVIAGDDGSQLLTAARSVVLGANLLQGDTVHLSPMRLPPPREADDAPLWMSTSTRSSLWNYSTGNLLQTDGSGALRVYLRLPPDLYFGDKTELPLQLDYRYNAISIADDSTLRVSMNDGLVNELRLPHEVNPHQQLSTDLAVPLIDLRPFSNTLLFNYYFKIAKKGSCQDTPPIDLQGAILRSSFLDISGLHHWAAMPNLELFSNAGFPFTRFADFSQTTIVLPPEPSGAELGIYLNLLAYFGEQTGYPALRVSVGDSGNLQGDRDFLVLGTATDQPAFAQLNRVLPVAIESDGLSIRNTDGFFQRLHHAWWQVAQLRPNWWWRAVHTPDLNGVTADVGQNPDALIEGVESPWASGRSVVAILLGNDESAPSFTAAFLHASTSSAISDSVSVLHGEEFTSYRLNDEFYRVGTMPWYAKARYYILEYPWLIVLFTFALGLFVVPWVRAGLDRRARERLEVGR